MDYDSVDAQIEIVKMMIASSDYVGARDKLNQMKHRFPAINNISAMIIVCDILISASFGFLGCGTDWYHVLQVTPAASQSDIHSQYRKFTTLLEPMKYSLPGTASALEIIRDAFFVLSNPVKRLLYDSERDTSLENYDHVNSHKGFTQTKEISPSFIAHETINGNKDIRNSKVISSRRVMVADEGVLLRGSNPSLTREVEHEEISTQTRVHRGNTVEDEQRKNRVARGNTAEDEQREDRGNTAENEQREDRVSRENSVEDKQRKNICTQNASKMIPPGTSECNISWSVNPVADKSYGRNFYNFNEIRKADVFAVGQVWAGYDEEDMPRSYAWINRIDKWPFRLHISWLTPAPDTEHERKWCEVGMPVACGFFYLDKAQETVTRPTILSQMVSSFSSTPTNQVEIYPQKNEIWAIYKDWKPYEWCKDPEARKGCMLQMVEILSSYSNQSDIAVARLVKVEGFKSVYRRYTKNGSEQIFPIPSSDLFMFSHSVPAYRFVGGEESGISKGMLELDCLAVPDILDHIMVEENSTDSFTFTHCAPTSPKAEPLKLKWSAKDFASNQIWTVYDGPGSMPRGYVVVNSVISGNEVCVTFLEPHPILDDEINWIEEKLPYVCGSFITGKMTLNLEMSRFSQLVKGERNANLPLYRIYPKKGEIWAMYKNWNTKWKQSDFCCYRCRIVEIVEDFSDDSGWIVVNLEEVPGCTTFFQRQLCDGSELIKAVSRTELLSFSHQIAAFTVPGIEIHGIPKGSWHLEPEELPPNFSS